MSMGMVTEFRSQVDSGAVYVRLNKPSKYQVCNDLQHPAVLCGTSFSNDIWCLQSPPCCNCLPVEAKQLQTDLDSMHTAVAPTVDSILVLPRLASAGVYMYDRLLSTLA